MGKILPHLKNDFLKTRNIVCDGDSKILCMNTCIKSFQEESPFKIKSPHFVIFVYDEFE